MCCKTRQMYKVFIDEKKIILKNSPISQCENISFSGYTSFSRAIDMLKNTSLQSVNIYYENIHDLWSRFCSQFQCIDAAGGVVFNNENKILFILRKSRWDLPKGKVEDGESMESAAIREVEEECSIFGLEIEKFISSTHHIYTYQKGKSVLKTTHWYKMRYSGSSSPIPQEIEGITKAEWKSLIDIHSEVYPNTFGNIRMLLDSVLNE